MFQIVISDSDIRIHKIKDFKIYTRTPGATNCLPPSASITNLLLVDHKFIIAYFKGFVYSHYVDKKGRLTSPPSLPYRWIFRATRHLEPKELNRRSDTTFVPPDYSILGSFSANSGSSEHLSYPQDKQWEHAGNWGSLFLWSHLGSFSVTVVSLDSLQ